MRKAIDEEGNLQEVETMASVEIKRSARGETYWTTKAYHVMAPMAALETAMTDWILDTMYGKSEVGDLDKRLKEIKDLIEAVMGQYWAFSEKLTEQLQLEEEETA